MINIRQRGSSAFNWGKADDRAEATAAGGICRIRVVAAQLFCLAVGPTWLVIYFRYGDLYIADTLNHRVQLLTAERLAANSAEAETVLGGPGNTFPAGATGEGCTPTTLRGPQDVRRTSEQASVSERHRFSQKNWK